MGAFPSIRSSQKLMPVLMKQKLPVHLSTKAGDKLAEQKDEDWAAFMEKEKKRIEKQERRKECREIAIVVSGMFIGSLFGVWSVDGHYPFFFYNGGMWMLNRWSSHTFGPWISVPFRRFGRCICGDGCIRRIVCSLQKIQL
jgi:hypothetical protein